MKKILYTLLLSALFISCGEKEKTSSHDLTLETNNYTLEFGHPPTVTIKIVSGNGGYNVSSSDESVAMAYKSGNNLVIGARKPGSVTIAVSDQLGKSASLNFTVASNYQPIIAEDKLVQVLRGQKKALAIPPLATQYKIVSVGNSATLKVENDTLFAIANATGVTHTWISNQDNSLISTYCTQVVDEFQLKLLTTEATMYSSSDYVFLIKSGNGGYSVSVTGDDIISQRVLVNYSPAKLVIEPQLNNPYYLFVATKDKNSLGVANITITDQKGKTATLKLKSIASPLGK